MMRQPTPASVLYAWHTAALRDPSIARHEGDPQCGWYRTRLVKGGPFVPVQIRVEREIDDDTGELLGPETLVALVDGQPRAPGPIWTHLTPISRAEFQSLQDRKASIPAMAATHAKLDLTEGPMMP